MGAKKVAVGWGEEEVFGNELELRVLVIKAITLMKRVQSNSQISTLGVKVDDGAINLFRKYNKSLFPKTIVMSRHTIFMICQYLKLDFLGS